MLDWRDICERCEAVVEFAADGVTSRHLCPRLPVTKDLLRAAGIVEPSLSSLLEHRFESRHRIVNWRVGQFAFESRHPTYRSIAARFFDSEREPARMGPFEPGTTPPIMLVADLLAWTRQDILELLDVGPKTLAKLEAWLARFDLGLTDRDDALINEYVWAAADVEWYG